MFGSGKIKVVKAIDIKERNRLSLGSFKMDYLLDGGLPSEGIVEVTGESGCGKSQLCMQLALTVQYPVNQGGLHGGALYICTEERFQSRRLYQLIENFPKAYYQHDKNEINFGDNILVIHVNEFVKLEQCLKKVPGLVVRKNLKMIIIDSITAVFRGNYAAYQSKQRVRDLRVIGSLLHKLSMKHKLLIVCVNQVAHSLSDKGTVPALGLAWSNFVTTRLWLTRSGSSRFIRVVYSPELASRIYTNFTIEANGVH